MEFVGVVKGSVGVASLGHTGVPSQRLQAKKVQTPK